jgi:hypothetical protein
MLMAFLFLYSETLIQNIEVPFLFILYISLFSMFMHVSQGGGGDPFVICNVTFSVPRSAGRAAAVKFCTATASFFSLLSLKCFSFFLYIYVLDFSFHSGRGWIPIGVA